MTRAFGISFSPRTTTKYTYQKNHDICLVGTTDGTHILPGSADLLSEGRKAPILIAWHYLRSKYHWKDQIATFMQSVENHTIDGFAIDFEKINNVRSQEFAYMAKLCIDKIVTDTKKRCMLYSSPSVVQEWMFPFEEYWIRRENYHLWVAQWPYVGYNSAMDNVTDLNIWQPRLPAGVPNWGAWQYSADRNGKAAENGIQGNLDVCLEVFNGTLADAKIFLKMEAPPEPPPPDDNLIVIKEDLTIIRERCDSIELHAENGLGTS